MTAVTAELAPEAVPDAGAFTARVLRLDPAALVRLRPASGDVVSLWARLPFGVLVTRLVQSRLTGDLTVRGNELLAGLARGETALPVPRDMEWRAPLPPAPGPVLDRVPTGELRRIAEAAADTLRSATGRGVGERRLRDELLNHVALIVTHGDVRTEVPVRLVQGLVRMGFLGPDDSDPVRVRRAGGWLGLEAVFGSAWYRPSSELRLL